MLDIKTALQEAKKIAIVGLSPDESKDSHQVGKYLQKIGYQIIPIYPKGENILGEKVYQELLEAIEDQKPDIVVVFRKAQACLQIALEVLKAKILPKVFWMQLGIWNPDARNILESKGIEVIENKCIKIEHQRILGE
ncbi:CoA-binding protein [Helicobacter sp. 11S03491-1]|uniref:CoA-binding protein n=1 Tax=Helicobacter sp. 11S03491-1 TaxID=1476196 RepID=UPI000BA7A671|nr:CoA-binding protein [Helicobacter sp. 11S03491-1]PAF42962.1 hypothetical protein BKH45_02520 [Helicobacter sp. 11S03491-1]